MDGKLIANISSIATVAVTVLLQFFLHWYDAFLIIFAMTLQISVMLFIKYIMHNA